LGICELSGIKPEEENVLKKNQSLESLIYKKFKHFSSEHLFFFQQKIVFIPSFPLRIEFRSVDVDVLTKKVLALYKKLI